MARNATLPLSPAQIAVCDKFLPILRQHAEAGTPVAIEYGKRNGTSGVSVGPVEAFAGQAGMTSLSVVLDTTESKGRPTTINVWLITAVA